MRTITPVEMSALLEDLPRTFPGFRLVVKTTDSRRCSTWGCTISVPHTFATQSLARQWIRLHHEMVHLVQFKHWGTWGFALRYLTPWGRYALEQEAYTVQFQEEMACFGAEYLLAKRQHYIDLFTGRAHWWCCPWPGVAARWVDRIMAQVLTTQGSPP